MNVDFWLGYRGPRHWQWGDLTPQQQRLWEESGKSFVTLAGIQWNILMDSFERAKASIPASRYLEVKYEDFAADPQRVFGDVLSFCQLEYPPEFRSAIDSFEIESANFKWRDSLTEQQRQQLEEVLADHLTRWGYSPNDVGPTAEPNGAANCRLMHTNSETST
jgi:hypothetical protein